MSQAKKYTQIYRKRATKLLKGHRKELTRRTKKVLGPTPVTRHAAKLLKKPY